MSEKKMRRKKACKWSKEEIGENHALLRALIGRPRFVCRCCGRVSKTKSRLCKPMAFDED